MNLQYKKMSLFDAPEGEYLVHACNAQGVWGSGIAAEFKKRYPEAYETYTRYCTKWSSRVPLTGHAFILVNNSNEQHIIGALITSKNYGKLKDSKEQIKINTALALHRFCQQLYGTAKTIYSNKFNSGLFSVPWEETELILKTVLEHHPKVTWVVCDPELQHGVQP